MGRRGVALGLVMAALAGCGGGSSSPDNGALGAVPSQRAPSPAPGAAPGPPVTTGLVGQVRTPRISGSPTAAAVDAVLTQVAQRIGAHGVACGVATERDDSRLLSFRWTCSDKSSPTATFDLSTGRQLTLDDLFADGYLPYLSTTAATQLQASGAAVDAINRAAAATPPAFADWDLTATDLQVGFALPGGRQIVDFPVSSLRPYLRPGGPL